MNIQLANNETINLLNSTGTASGMLVSNTQVNTAISTINGNFTNLNNFIGSWVQTAQVTVGSVASGWSFSPDKSTWNNKLRFYHWGCMGYVLGYARKSSALAANTNSNSIGVIAWPSGYTMISNGGSVGDQRLNMVIATAGNITVFNITAIPANDVLIIRAFMPVASILNLENVATL